MVRALHLDDDAVKACTVLAAQCSGRVKTIEGLALDGSHHPMQEAFKACHALQCGFCTPGMIMSAVDLVEKSDELDEAMVREQLEGNLCRCTGYQNIAAAVIEGANRMRGNKV